MVLQRNLSAWVVGAALACPAACQAAQPAAGASALTGWPSRGYLGLTPGRTRAELSCGMPGFACDGSPQLYGGYLLSRTWAVEVGYVQLGRTQRGASSSRLQAVDVGLVGRARLGDSFGLSGRIGTAYGRGDTSVMGAPSSNAEVNSFGLSYGAGMSWSFSRTGQATFGYDSRELKLVTGRATVRSADLGLQWRY